MDDLISRLDAITIPVLPKEHRKYQTMNPDDAYESGWFDCQKCIENLPSAQPAAVLCNELRISTLPKIVMCKDCRFRIHGDCYVSNFKSGLPCMIRFVRENDFCSMAERRTDDRE